MHDETTPDGLREALYCPFISSDGGILCGNIARFKRAPSLLPSKLELSPSPFSGQYIVCTVNILAVIFGVNQRHLVVSYFVSVPRRLLHHDGHKQTLRDLFAPVDLFALVDLLTQDSTSIIRADAKLQNN